MHGKVYTKSILLAIGNTPKVSTKLLFYSFSTFSYLMCSADLRQSKDQTPAHLCTSLAASHCCDAEGLLTHAKIFTATDGSFENATENGWGSYSGKSKRSKWHFNPRFEDDAKRRAYSKT